LAHLALDALSQFATKQSFQKIASLLKPAKLKQKWFCHKQVIKQHPKQKPNYQKN